MTAKLSSFDETNANKGPLRQFIEMVAVFHANSFRQKTTLWDMIFKKIWKIEIYFPQIGNWLSQF